MKFTHIFFFPILAIIQISSCQSDKDRLLRLEKQELLGIWKNLEIEFPQSLIPLELNPKEKQINSGFTIVVFYDGDCSVCYIELMKWIQLIDEFNELNFNTNFRIILSGNNEFILRHHLEKIKFPIEYCYYDSKNEFIDQYQFFIAPNYWNASVLLDENHKILTIGNPIISSKNKNEFLGLLSLDDDQKKK